MRKLNLALSTAALVLSGAAIAQNATTAPPSERPARAAKPDMTRADAQARAERMFARMDANQDGAVDQADRAARKARMFDRIDADKDGAISRAEFDAMHAKRAEARGDGKRRMGHRMGRHHGGVGGKWGASATPMTRQAFLDRALARFDRTDANRDGTVTQAERKAARETMREQWKARRAARQQG